MICASSEHSKRSGGVGILQYLLRCVSSTYLQTLGPIRAAVLGHFGECSPDIHHLVRAAQPKAWRLPDGGPWERDLSQRREVSS